MGHIFIKINIWGFFKNMSRKFKFDWISWVLYLKTCFLHFVDRASCNDSWWMTNVMHKFFSMYLFLFTTLYMFRAHSAHHQERQIVSIQPLVKIILYWWPRCVQVVRSFFIQEWRPIYDNISLSSSQKQKCLDKFIFIIKTHVLFPITFSENRPVYEKMWKNIVEPDRPQMTMQ